MNKFVMIALLACVAVAMAAEKEELQTAEGNLYSGLGYAGGYGGYGLGYAGYGGGYGLGYGRSYGYSGLGYGRGYGLGYSGLGYGYGRGLGYAGYGGYGYGAPYYG